MQKVYQTYWPDENHTTGNCIQAVVASILELSIEDVPDFLALYGGDGWWVGLEDFVSRFGLQPVGFPIGADGWHPSGYYILDGKSPRGDWNHLVVAHSGVTVHDPNPAGDGTLTPPENYIVFIHTMEHPFIPRDKYKPVEQKGHDDPTE